MLFETCSQLICLSIEHSLSKNAKQKINKIENEKDELTAVEIIINNKNPTQCSVILNDEWFSIPYETTYNNELIKDIKKTIQGQKILLIQFIDKELPEAWADAYAKAGILEKYPQDRRLQFHAYNDMNEQFCIDRTLFWNITDYFKGTPHELTKEKSSWMWYITQWYKAHLI